MKCNRDTHDLSFQNNLTARFGYLHPCMCKEVSAGDSWHIQSAFGLRFLPTFFPIQTKIKAKIDFFYVRYRNIFDDWQNWRYGTGNPQSFPVLSDSEALEQSKTGSLGDYLGLPSTLVGGGLSAGTTNAVIPKSSPQSPTPFTIYDSELVLNSKDNVVNYPASPNQRNNFVFFLLNTTVGSTTAAEKATWPLASKQGFSVTPLVFTDEQISDFNSTRYRIGIASYSESTFTLIQELPCSTSYFENNHLIIDKTFVLGNGRYFVIWQTMGFNTNIENTFGQFPSWNNISGNTGTLFNVVEATSVFNKIPYAISAAPFRAYEQIYNSFYRDDRNNPFFVDGVYDPNKFLPTTAGGVDSTPYRLRKRNWEQDFLTSAVPSPQFGNAPLVGITSVSASGVATLEASDGTVYSTQLKYDENDQVVGFSATPSSSANSKLINLASSGISINDLRAVNSLQKYLELHYRRGLRYRDQMMSHRGIEIRYDTLDMPEFIGSVVQNIDVSQINQTSNSIDGDPLGSYAGQLSAVGGSSKLSKYCDEDGIIMAILSIVPVPCYSQLLPKHFTKVNDPLEYFDPSFRNLGYQAIPYREVCPLQAANSGISLDSTFGYQRAWYDYLQSQDEIHGQFRTTLNNYVLSRVFNTVPSLNPDFLTVDPSSLNDIFSVSEVTLDDGTKVQLDTILGQIHFNIAVERQIPAYAIASL